MNSFSWREAFRLHRMASRRLVWVAALLSLIAASPRANELPETGSAGDDSPQPLVASDFLASDPQLVELIAALLRENPQIQSARATWRSRRERVPQARSLPDPQISYRYFAKTPETRVGPQEQMLELSQGVPWFGKRDLEAQRASHMASDIAWRVRNLERSLVATLKRSYFDAVYLQEALASNSEEKALLQRFEKIALIRYSTGEGIQQSVIKVQTDISRLADQKTSLRQQLDAVVRRIEQLTGGQNRDLHLEPVSLEFLDVSHDQRELEQDSFALHPGIRAAQEQIEGNRVWHRRQHLESRPDFKFGLGYGYVDEREDLAGILNPPMNNGGDVLGLTVGLNLPVYRRKFRAAIAEARESIRSSERHLQDTRDRLRFEIQESILRLESLGDRARFYGEVIIPQAEESLASAEAAYTTNRQDFLDLLDAERILFEVRLTYDRLLADYWIALVDLELAVGHRFPEGDTNHE